MVSPVNDSTPLPPRPDPPRTPASGSPVPVAGSGAWKLSSLPTLATTTAIDKSRADFGNRDAAASPLSSSPTPLQSPMSTFANALAMKKRFSDSLTDSWSRRRPSLPQGSIAPPIPGITSRHKDYSTNGSSSSKSRNRASSAATATTVNYSRSPPSLSSSASLVTIASTTSSVSSSSFRGGLSRRDSYSDVISRGYSTVPLASIPSRGNTPGGDSPTVPPSLDPVRNVSSQPIANLGDIRQVEEESVPLDFQGGYWEEPIAGTFDPAVQAAADVGMRRMGITRKISDSRRIMATPVLESTGSELDEEDESTPRCNRESTLSGSQSVGYDLSSDEESTTSSVGTKSTSNSSRVGLQQTVSFSHTKRVSRPIKNTPLPDSQPSDKRPPSAVDRQVSSLSRPQSSTGSLSRAVTASPMRPGLAKARHTPGLETGSSGDDSVSRLSSLAGKVANQQQSAASSRSASANINNVARSDSNSSTASTSTNAPSTRTTTPSVVQQKQVSPRDRVVATKIPLAASSRTKARHPPSLEPPIPDPSSAPKVEPAPSSGMYWYKAPAHGLEHKPLRAHTCTLVGSNIYVFGGCDLSTCFNVLHVFDADSMSWSKPHVYGEVPPPLRAMTCTAVRNKLVIFGGGDGPTYYNDIYVFDTATSRYTRPPITGGPEPCRRRAHTACLYKNGIYVFGGGDGVRALNDVWRLDVADLNKPNWKLVSSAAPPGARSAVNSNSNTAIDQIKPSARGYHTANMVGSKLIIFGGSDGDECFKDVWVFDVETTLWRCVEIKKSFSRLSHSATVIGSYLFVVGGHDGVEYSSEVLLLNLGMSGVWIV